MDQQTFPLTWTPSNCETDRFTGVAEGNTISITHKHGPIEYLTGKPNADALPEELEREIYDLCAVHTPDPELTDALVIMRNLDAWRNEMPSFDKDDRGCNGYGLPVAIVARDRGVDVESLAHLKQKTLYPGQPLSKALDVAEEQTKALAAAQKEAAERDAAERKRPRPFATGPNGYAMITGPIGPIPPTCADLAAALGDNAFSKSSKRERVFIPAPPGLVWPRTDLTNGFVLHPYEHVENLLPHEMPPAHRRNDWSWPFWDLISRNMQGNRGTLDDATALDLTTDAGRVNYEAAVDYLRTNKRHIDYQSEGSNPKIQWHTEAVVAKHGNLRPELLLSAFEAADCLQDPARCIGAGSSDSRPNRNDIMARVKRYRQAGDRFVRSEVPVIVEQDDSAAIIAATKDYLRDHDKPASEKIHEHLASLGLKDQGGRVVAGVLRDAGLVAKIIPINGGRERRWVPCVGE